jgi:hypothetical protein
VDATGIEAMLGMMGSIGILLTIATTVLLSIGSSLVGVVA